MLFLPAIKIIWCEEISSEDTLNIMSARILVSSLYIGFTRDIDRKSTGQWPLVSLE